MTPARAVVAGVIACLLVHDAVAAKKPPEASGCALLPPKGEHPPLADADRSLTELPFAPGSPAVWLLKADHRATAGWGMSTTVRKVRRLKVLTAAGARQHGDMTEWIPAGAKVLQVRARTVLPDGAVHDAKDSVHEEKDAKGRLRSITVTFPAVAPGAILDLDFVRTGSHFLDMYWDPQDELPVLDARWILEPPQGVALDTMFQNVPEAARTPQECRFALNVAHVFRLQELAALPDVPWSPPADTLSARILLIPLRAVTPSGPYPIASTWAEYAVTMRDVWDEWLDGKCGEVKTLARATAPKDLPEAERVRLLRAKLADVRVDSELPTALLDSPDAVLAARAGSSGDVAGLHVAALRAAGVEAHLAGYRLRSSGPLPEARPVPSLVDAVLVTASFSDGSRLFYDAGAPHDQERLPVQAAGCLVLPYAKGVTKPVRLPEVWADDVATRTEVSVSVARDGTVSGDATVRWEKAAAESLRRVMREETPEERKDRVRPSFATTVPGWRVLDVVVDGVEDPSGALVARARMEGSLDVPPGPGRVFVPVSVTRTVDPAEWPDLPRVLPIDMRNPGHAVVVTRVTLPEGTTGLAAPGDVHLPAPGAGDYAMSSTVSADGRTLETRVVSRRDAWKFGAASWPELRRWHLDAAAAEERLAAASLP